jgi:hypothetical protein
MGILTGSYLCGVIRVVKCDTDGDNPRHLRRNKRTDSANFWGSLPRVASCQNGKTSHLPAQVRLRAAVARLHALEHFRRAFRWCVRVFRDAAQDFGFTFGRWVAPATRLVRLP